MCANFESLEEREIPETRNIRVTCDIRCNSGQRANITPERIPEILAGSNPNSVKQEELKLSP